MANDDRPVKTPKMELYNFNGNLIASNMEEYPIGVVSIRYKFDDEEDDRCLIKIQASDTTFIDLIDIRRKDRLYVNWGYINGRTTGKVMVVVRDIKSKYGPNITWTELECSDAATFLKLTKSQDALTTSLIDYMKDYCVSKLKIIIKESGKILYKQGINTKAGDELKLEVVSVPEGLGFKDPYQEPGSDTRLQEESYKPGTWFGDGVVKDFLEKEVDLVTAGRSPYIIIREKMRLCPNGPWYVSGRGNTLFIHNRNLGGKIYKGYVYKGEPGDLIDFTAATKYENFEKRTATQMGVDPLSKSTHFIDAYLEILEKLKSFKEIIEDKNSTQAKKEDELQVWLYVYNNGYKRYKAGKLPVEITADGNTWPVKEWSDYLRRGIPLAELTDKTKTEYPSDITKYGETTFNPVKVIGRTFLYSAPIESWDEANANMANTLRGMEMEKEEGKFIVEGDPDLINDLVVNIANVQATHKGNYYIKVCEHEISQSGYKCTMDSLKIVEEAKIRVYQESGTQEEDIDGLKFQAQERYSLEENVFRKWDIKIWIKRGVRYLSADPMVSNTVGDYAYDVGDWVSLEDFQAQLGPDEDIEKALLNLYDTGNLKFSSNQVEPNTEVR